MPVPLAGLLLKLWPRWEVEFRWLKSGFGLVEKPCWGFDSGERSVAWRAWVYGALMWSGYCGWDKWVGGARLGGRGRARWTFRNVLWSVQSELVGGGRRWLKRVGFLQARLLAALPSRAFLPPCKRDARAPSTRDARNAGVPPAMPNRARKNYPFTREPSGSFRDPNNTNRAFRVYELPPSFRFPPLREGNRARVRFPLLAGGTLRRGSSTACFCELWLDDWYND